ncbi:MAG: magnesium transporter CorA family protein [Eubacteriales bacterium]|jgi:magnesium transporter
MISYYKTVDKKLELIEHIEPGCWVSLVAPTEEEVNSVIETLQVDAGFVQAGLDEEEASRVEMEDEQTLIVVDLPLAQTEAKSVVYSTVPMAIILTQDNIVTVCLKETSIIKEFSSSLVKNVETTHKTRFVLLLLYKIAGRFLQYLKQIDKISLYVEKKLHKSMRNKELIQLLELEKSLVYFSTSLKANEVTLEKILRGRIIKLYDEDQDLLEDVLIEVKQAIEMSNIYTNILSGTMDAFASIISNNLNIVMKVLASITILMAIPTIISSFYGMNVEGIPLSGSFWYPVGMSVAITLAGSWLLHKKGML